MRENVNELVRRLKVPGEFITFNEALIYKVESKTGLKAWKIYPGFFLAAAGFVSSAAENLRAVNTCNY